MSTPVKYKCLFVFKDTAVMGSAKYHSEEDLHENVVFNIIEGRAHKEVWRLGSPIRPLKREDFLFYLPVPITD